MSEINCGTPGFQEISYKGRRDGPPGGNLKMFHASNKKVVKQNNFLGEAFKK